MSTNQEIPVPDALPADPPPQPSPRFQFGISTLLGITTGTAVICALLFPMPGSIAIPLMVFITFTVLPAVWTTVIIYGRGYQRTFGIGAMFPVGVLLLCLDVFGRTFGALSMGSGGGDDRIIRLTLFVLWISCLLVGMICVGVRRFLERRPSSPALQNRFRDPIDRDNGE
jgi:hypothetical protein